MENTLELLDNYLEWAVKDNLNVVEVLDYIFSEEASAKRRRAYDKQLQMSGFPIIKELEDFDFTFQPSIDKRQINELASILNLTFVHPLFILKTGPISCGKWRNESNDP